MMSLSRPDGRRTFPDRQSGPQSDPYGLDWGKTLF
jgi:hypothetical protein